MNSHNSQRHMPNYSALSSEYANDMILRARMIMMMRSSGEQSDTFTVSPKPERRPSFIQLESLNDCLQITDKCAKYFDTLFDKKLKDTDTSTRLQKTYFRHYKKEITNLLLKLYPRLKNDLPPCPICLSQFKDPIYT